MDLIKGIFGLAVIIFIIWLANAFFELVGGWPGVIAVVVCIVTLIFFISSYLARRQEIDKLKETPMQVQALIEAAQVHYREGADCLERARVEFEEERRAPLFWDRIYECNDALHECGDKLEQARGKIDDYNRRAPRFNLDSPRQLDSVPPAAFEDTVVVLDSMSLLANRALSVSDFALVYEQRKQTKILLDAQKALQSDITQLARETRQAMDAARAAAHAASKAQSASESATRASKRAAGDWF